jgi:hypothetical protein
MTISIVNITSTHKDQLDILFSNRNYRCYLRICWFVSFVPWDFSTPATQIFPPTLSSCLSSLVVFVPLYLLVCACVVCGLVLSCLVLSRLVLSCLVLPLSCHARVLPRLVLSCLDLTWLVLSCLVLSCLVLSCLVVIFFVTSRHVTSSCVVVLLLVVLSFSCVVMSCIVFLCLWRRLERSEVDIEGNLSKLRWNYRFVACRKSLLKLSGFDWQEIWHKGLQ